MYTIVFPEAEVLNSLANIGKFLFQFITVDGAFWHGDCESDCYCFHYY